MANDQSPRLCANGCGFYGTSAAKKLCSECFKDNAAKEQLVDSSSLEYRLQGLKPVVAPRPPNDESPSLKRCSTCRKKLGLLGFKCMCGDWCCASHRYPEVHGCFSHYKDSFPDDIARANPLMVADKLQNRI